MAKKDENEVHIVVPLVHVACVMHNTMGCRDAYWLLLVTRLLGSTAGCLVNLAVVGLDLGSLGSLHNELKGSSRSTTEWPLTRVHIHG